MSSFLIFETPPRHGKSDITSRTFPAFFLGAVLGDPDIILTGYGSSLVEGFSRAARRLVHSKPYRRVFPRNTLAWANKNAVTRWSLDGRTGEVVATGLGGALTGHGGNLITVDDYCKRRAEAESKTYRDGVWDAFTNDLMTRRAPTSIVIVTATRWHVDDLIARIEERSATDEHFPQFERWSFPAWTEDYGWLFPERFSPEWYRSQEAALGAYSSASLLYLNPTIRSGNLLRADRVQVHAHFPSPATDAPMCRFWDLASTQKQRANDDPDFTWGSKVSLTYEHDDGIPDVWIHDSKYCQAEAPKRDALIGSTIESDGPDVVQVFESVAGYLDTYRVFRERFMPRGFLIRSFTPRNDKVVNATPLEMSFELGRVHVQRGAWNQEFLEQCSAFPLGNHDDAVDSLAGAFRALDNRLTSSYSAAVPSVEDEDEHGNGNGSVQRSREEIQNVLLGTSF